MGQQQRSGTLGLGVLALIAVVLIVAAVVAGGAGATSSRGCERCHFANARFKKATQATAHAKVPCAACHLQTNSLLAKGKFGVYVALGMRVRLLDAADSDISLVRDEYCLACHRSVNAKTLTFKGMRIEHATCAVGRKCIDCHSGVGHGTATAWPRTAAMNDCVACHKKTKNSLACDTCHAGKSQAEKLANREFAVTHGPNWKKTHGMGPMNVCSLCHAEAECSKCHGPGVPHSGTFVAEHAKYSTRSDAKCTMCHRPAFCTSCHQLEMPHPKSFTPNHSRLLKENGALVMACVRCHSTKDCETCHEKHVHPGGAVGRVPSPAKGGKK